MISKNPIHQKRTPNQTHFFSIPLLTRKWAYSRHLQYQFWLKTGSTNQNAKKDAQDLIQSKFKLYIAQHQTLGKGRNQKTWKDQGKGGELLTSWIYKINSCPQHLTSLFAGIGLYQSVKKIWPSLKWSLKPPNDLYLNTKKIAGLLLESLSLPLERENLYEISTKNTFKKKNQIFLLIIGLGFNFLSFPKDQKNATRMTEKDFSLEKYFYFLDRLFLEFSKASEKALRISLNEEEQKTLEEALRAYPNEQYFNVTEKGDLITQKGKILWKDL